jgi:hypothetical protein
MKRFAQILTVATIATFAFGTASFAASHAEEFLSYNNYAEEGPQGAVVDAPETMSGILAGDLVFDNTQADFDKSQGVCPTASTEAGSRKLAELGALDSLHGIGH